MLLTLAFKQAQPVEYDWQAWPSSPFSQHESFGAATDGAKLSVLGAA